jgi:biotin operon repressor
MSKLPAFQFYPGDWMKDPALRSTSVAARGLWTDMLCLMFESVRRGYLQHATGKPWTPDQLARVTGCSADEVSRLLQELEDSGVFSSTEHGVVYSRRMVREEKERQRAAERKRQERTRNEEGESGKTSNTVEASHADVTPMSRGPSRDSHNPSSSSSSSSPSERDGESVSRAPARSTSRKPKACDEEFLEELQANPAYRLLNVRECFHRMDVWCRVKGKQPTRARFINWLNREDRPMALPERNGHSPPKEPFFGCPECAAGDTPGYVLAPDRSRMVRCACNPPKAKQSEAVNANTR